MTAPLDVEGCFNFRDAGGWTTTTGRSTRHGLLYRADEPQRLTTAGRLAVDALGLRAVIDLRAAHHFERGDGFGDGAITHHVPVIDRLINTNQPPSVDSAEGIADLYDQIVEFRRDNVVHALELIARHTADGPVLVHCTAGKDRTGIVVALVQAAIGVPMDAIVAEYARSDEPTRRRRAAMIADPLPGDPDVARSPELIWTAPAVAMQRFAARAVERCGSLEAWPSSLGVSREAVAALRANLVE